MPWYCCSLVGTRCTIALPSPPSREELKGNSSQETWSELGNGQANVALALTFQSTGLWSIGSH